MDSGYDIGEAELTNKQSIRVDTVDELEQVLARWLNDFEKFVQPAFCGYPIQ